MKLSGMAQAYKDDLMEGKCWVSGFALHAARELEEHGLGVVSIEGPDGDPCPYVFTPKQARKKVDQNGQP